VIAGRRADVLASAAKEIGPNCSFVIGDVREPGDAAAIVDAALERHGRLDFLLNNAGGQYFVPAEGVRLARRAARDARGTGVQCIRRHDRRGARQLDGPMAALGPQPGG
jgi:NAD(P)-dependent dehydrogenase (short-subunit alcohol dehydrogenase family)